MKKFLVIGNPIEHSLSPKLQNYWMKKNNINGLYKKKKLNDNELENLVSDIRNKNLIGVNVTVPFKRKIISYIDELEPSAEKTQSVNTIYLKSNKVVGQNTDIDGFERALKFTKFETSGKKIFILGAGGVVPSIITALNKMKASTITISNRTRQKAEDLKHLFKNIKIVDWGNIPDFDIIINSTSVGLNKNDVINLDFSNVGKNKMFYDLIYNPKETNFLKSAKKQGNFTENGKMMFIYQASSAFKIWHGIEPEINDEVIKFIDQ